MKENLQDHAVAYSAYSLADCQVCNKPAFQSMCFGYIYN